MEIFLGDEDGEEIDEAPTETMLSAFADTYRDFLDNIEIRLNAIQHGAFERYQKLYAKYYENPLQSRQPAMNINNVQQHNPHINKKS